MPSGACKDFRKRLLDQSNLDTLLAGEQFLWEKKPVKNHFNRNPTDSTECSGTCRLCGGNRCQEHLLEEVGLLKDGVMTKAAGLALWACDEKVGQK